MTTGYRTIGGLSFLFNSTTTTRYYYYNYVVGKNNYNNNIVIRSSIILTTTLSSSVLLLLLLAATATGTAATEVPVVNKKASEETYVVRRLRVPSTTDNNNEHNNVINNNNNSNNYGQQTNNNFIITVTSNILWTKLKNDTFFRINYYYYYYYYQKWIQQNLSLLSSRFLATTTTQCSWLQQPPKKQDLSTKEPTVVLASNNNNNNTTTTSLYPSISSYSPYPPFHIIQPNPNLEICYDKRTRNAIFVQHRIILGGSTNRTDNKNTTTNDDNTEITDIDDNNDNDTDDDDDDDTTNNQKTTGQRRKHRRRRYRFREDISVPEQYRSRNSHYHLSGYDRGHLAPAGDFIMNQTNSNSYLSEKEIEDTYNLCNISPQNQSMNRTIWSYLEYYIRKVTYQIYEKERTSNEDCTITTYVTTGPLWLPERQVSDKAFQYNFMALGKPPSLVHVPTHFYKAVIIVKNNNEIIQFGCFVIPNNDNAAKQSIGDYMVSWIDLETVTGLTFYPNLLSTEWKETADRITQQTIQQQNDGRHLSKQQIMGNDNWNVLLLSTDSSSSSSSNNGKSIKMTRWVNPSYSSGHTQYPLHLCANKACLRPNQK